MALVVHAVWLRQANRRILQPYIWMLLASSSFAVMALLAESLRDSFSFPWIAMVRSAIATVLAWSMTMASGAPLAVFRPATLWLRSISGWMSMMCGFYAFTHYDVSIALALTNMYPIWVSLLSWPMLKQVPTARTWLALIVSTCGMWLLYSDAFKPTEAMQRESSGYVPELAIPMAVLAGVFSGFALIGLHRVQGVDARAIVTHFSAVSTILSLCLWCLIPWEFPNQAVDANQVYKLMGVGLAATVGQLLLTKAFTSGNPSRVSVVGLSQVMIAAAIKWVLESRVPSQASCMGMILILGATIWVMLHPVTIQEQAIPSDRVTQD